MCWIELSALEPLYKFILRVAVAVTTAPYLFNKGVILAAKSVSI